MHYSFPDTRLPAGTVPVARSFVAGIDHILQDPVRGIYVTGSVALDDYRPGKSDLDFIVLCDVLPTGAVIENIRQLHASLARQYPAIPLNGVYLNEQHLAGHHSSAVLRFQENRLTTTNFEMAPVSLLELRSKAITVYGVSARQLRIELEEKDVTAFLHRNMNSYWQDWVRKHSSLTRKKSLLLLFPRLTEWSLLGVARQLYTLRTGGIISKTGAGHYCLEQLPARYHRVVKEAIEIRTDPKKYFAEVRPSYYIQPSLRRCNETLDCAQYMIDLFNEAYIVSKKA